jgi:hypothetical protein
MFKLVIECSKDIDNLSINFSDGTSVVTESTPRESKEPKIKEVKESKEPREYKEPKERKKLDTYLDTEDDYEMTQEVVQKPIIKDVQRPANVSEELQNLDI